MSVIPTHDRRTERHQATRAEILAAAWELAREQGLAGISMRDLGARVGMRAQSIYSYFDSKFAIYDAMFREGNEELLARMGDLPAAQPGDDARAAFVDGAHVFAGFAVEDAARSQLLFHRPIPGFEPSPDAYEPAVRVLEITRQALAAIGVTDPCHVDLWTAVLAGIVEQQNANDPGGDRWTRLIDEAVAMFLAFVAGGRSKDNRENKKEAP